MDELRQEAAATDGPIPTLYKSKINKLLDEGLNLVADCPNYKNIKSSLYNIRNRACGVSRLNAKTAGEVQVSNLLAAILLILLYYYSFIFLFTIMKYTYKFNQ